MQTTTFYPKLSFQLENLSIQLIRVSNGKITDAIPPHKHGNHNFEIHYITSGSGWVQLEDNRIPIRAGDLFVTGPGILHSQFSNFADPMAEYCLNLVIRTDDENATILLDKFANFFESGLQLFKSSSLTLLDELQWTRPYHKESCICILKMILIDLFRRVQSANPKKATQKADTNLSERVLLIDQYFIACPAEASLSDLAEQLYLSTRQTQRVIRESFGVSFSEKLAEARCSKAEILLAESDLKIGEIAALLGFSSLEHFSRSFKKMTGLAPSTYRKSFPADQT